MRVRRASKVREAHRALKWLCRTLRRRAVLLRWPKAMRRLVAFDGEWPPLRFWLGQRPFDTCGQVLVAEGDRVKECNAIQRQRPAKPSLVAFGDRALFVSILLLVLIARLRRVRGLLPTRHSPRYEPALRYYAWSPWATEFGGRSVRFPTGQANPPKAGGNGILPAEPAEGGQGGSVSNGQRRILCIIKVNL
jgi:hypothetical protein